MLLDHAPSARPAPATDRRAGFRRAAFWLTFASAASILISIAASQILIGAALVALLSSGERIRWPAIRLPLALFVVATVAAVLLSPDPVRGLPQIRKFYVFAILPLIFTTFEGLPHVRALLLAWAGIAGTSAIWGLEQFRARPYVGPLNHADEYVFYLDGRITGFAGHWMTFGGQQMIVCLFIIAFLLFAAKSKWKIYASICLALGCAALVVGLTRSIFLFGLPIGVLYLLLNSKWWTVAALPVVAVGVFYLAPFHIRERILSSVRPHGDFDSNNRRIVMLRTGWAMVKAHPWFGVGPEQVEPQFASHVPADVRRPLPRGWYGHLHNVYVQYAAERGLLAVACLLWLTGKVLRDFHRELRQRNEAAPEVFVLHGAVAAILAILAEGFFEHNLGDSEVLTMFLTVIACGYVVIARPLGKASCA